MTTAGAPGPEGLAAEKPTAVEKLEDAVDRELG
jgi:hypothetical protein